MDFRDIKGQEHVKRGLEVRHDVILIGPKGAPTDEIARLIATITPAGQHVEAYIMRPCPCGNFTNPKQACRCTPRAIQRHLAAVPKPILDKADIHIEVPIMACERKPHEGSAEIKARIEAAQAHMGRWKHGPAMDKEADELLKLAILELGISARAYDKIERVARTIAGMDGKDIVEACHVSEAIGYRSLDRNLWG